MHNLGIAHRDLKLQNILLKNDEENTPVIADFGLSIFSEEMPYLFNRCGTPGFIAPEIFLIRGEEDKYIGP